MKKLWIRFVTAYVDLAFKRAWTLFFLFVALAVVCGFFASRHLRVVTDLAALLPEGTPSVRALEESERRIGSTDFFVIAIRSDDADARAIAQIQDAIGKRIEAQWEDADWIQYERDTSFFKKHALYYVPTEDLIKLRDTLSDELNASAREHIPGMVDLLGDDEGEDDEGGSGLVEWYDPDMPRKLGLPEQVAAQFDKFFEKRDPQSRAEEKNNKVPPDLADRLIASSGRTGVVLVGLAKPSTDLDYAKMALARGQDLIDSLDIQSVDPSMDAQVVGAYRSFKEVDAVSKDALVATSISVGLVLFLMLIFFRSGRTAFIVMTPLAVAGSVTMLITGLTYGRLTVLTVFVLAMLAGMGIDYGIHLYGRALQEYRSGLNLKDAVRASLLETGKALFVAALTTIISLLTLLLGHFSGFKEFGVVASFGLVICVLSATLVMPPTLAATARLTSVSMKGWLGAAQGATTNRSNTIWGMRVKTLVGICFALATVLTVSLAPFVPKIEFEHDFRNLRAPSTKNTIHYGDAIGSRSAGTTPSVMLGHSVEQMRQVHEFFSEKLENDDPLIKGFITLYTFVPDAKTQKERRQVIEEIGDIVEKRAMRRLKNEKGRMVDELRDMAKADPFTAKDIPEWALNIITERDGTVGRIGHLHTAINTWDARALRHFQDSFGFLEFEDRWLPIASSGFILADVVRMVQADGIQLLIAVSIILVIIMAIFSRSLRGTFVLTTTLALAGLWTVGICGLFDIRIGLYNVIVVPVILGVGIDGAIHMYHRHIALGRRDLALNLRTTGITVTASSWTTVAGFLGLLFVSHNGLQTIGVLATIGVGIAWLSVLIVLPFLLSILVRPRKEKA